MLAGADDAPGAAVIGMLLMMIAVVLGVRAARNRLPMWAARTALAVGGVLAAFAAFLTHGVVVTAPLFAQSQEVPSAVDSAPAPQYAAAIERARERVRVAILEQSLPGVSVAVGAGGSVVWAEGFGWRDVVTRTPVTPATRFNIGTAASAVTASVAPLGLTNTGADPAANGVPSMSASRKRTSRSSPSSATSSSGRSVSPLRSHCRAIARRSMSRDPTTIPAVDGG